MNIGYRRGLDCRRCGQELNEQNFDQYHSGICNGCYKDGERQRYANKAHDTIRSFVHRPRMGSRHVTKSASSSSFLDPDQMRVACFDIEATGLTGDFGAVLCCVIKTYGSPERKVFSVDFDYSNLLSSEKEMLVDIRDCLSEYDGISGYYSSRYDIPMLRTRMMYHGIRPNIPKMKHLDVYFTIKRNINSSTRRMERIGDLLRANALPELPDKTDLNPDVWIRATHGRNAGARDYIIDHCIHDVDLLEGILVYVKEQGWVPDRVLRM